MAKVIENTMLTPIITLSKYRHPAPSYKRCGCGREAGWEVYKDHQPHCHDCLMEAVSTGEDVQVRSIMFPSGKSHGDYDDAS